MDSISVIICTRQHDISPAQRANIASTIGCTHEIIVIDNSQNRYSIFEAYNEGVRRSCCDICCFMHDDVLLRTEGWGKNIASHFDDEGIGMIGVAGSHFMPNVPTYWTSSPFISEYNITTDESASTLNQQIDRYEQELAEVAVTDGLFYCIPRKLFPPLYYDEKSYTGFHAYDMDISMQVQTMGKRVCVTKAILVEHFWSESRMKENGYHRQLEENLEIFIKKWSSHLPMTRGIDQPPIVTERINQLYQQAYDAVRARRSKAYRLGRFMLTPLRWMKSLASQSNSF